MWVPIGIVLVLAIGVLLVTIARTQPAVREDDRIARAQQLYRQKKEMGVSMDTGPCLGTLEADWVVDVAHMPRAAADDQPANQCAAYRDGTAQHFIELTPEGDFLRLQ